MKQSIGFVGLGQMGQPMALNLLRAGFELRVFDVREERLAPLLEWGAQRAPRLEDVTEPGGIVVTMVPDDRTLLQVALGEGGILQRIGQDGIHLSLSTVSPEVAAQLAKLYEHQGSYYVSATVLGRPEVAEARQLTLFVSGHPTGRTLVQPVLQAIAQNTYDLGERVELANVFKLGYNFLIAAAIEAMGEAAALVERCGANRARFLRMLVEFPLFKGTVYQGYGHMIGDRDYSDARFPVAMGLKDVELVLHAAERVNLPLPYAGIAYEHLLAAQAAGRSHEDWSVLADFVAQATAGEAVSARGGRPGQANR
jgi:3-hydroxyisobutyrate dehydrogenase-like beta-hydroxyacid dehydrogenase